jgi:hypothetical protein
VGLLLLLFLLFLVPGVLSVVFTPAWIASEALLRMVALFG